MVLTLGKTRIKSVSLSLNRTIRHIYMQDIPEICVKCCTCLILHSQSCNNYQIF